MTHKSPTAIIGSVVKIYFIVIFSLLFACGECKTNAELKSTLKDTSSISRGDSQTCNELLKRFFILSDVKKWVEENYSDQWTSQAIVLPFEMELKGKCGSAIVGGLVNYITSYGDPYIKVASAYMLMYLTGRDFGDNHAFLASSEKAKDVENISYRWLDWWGKNRNKTQCQWYVNGLQDTAFSVAEVCIVGLGRLGDTSAVQYLKTVFQRNNRRLSFFATEALAKLGNKAAIPYLIELYLSNDGSMFREKGIEYLKKLTGETLGCDPHSSKAEQKECIERWKQWLRRHRS